MSARYQQILLSVSLTLVLLVSPVLPTFPGHAADTVGKLGSVGLHVVPTGSGELVVLHAPEGTPAARAGLKPGDLLVQIDRAPLAGSDFAKVVSQHLWGIEGSTVVIHYLRPGEAGRRTVTLRRVAADPKLMVSPAVRDGAAQQGGQR